MTAQWTHGPASGWTDEQAANATAYGVCLQCGAPREARTVGDPPTIEIVCPNSHPAWKAGIHEPIVP